MLEELKEWLADELASVEDNERFDVDSGAGAITMAYWSGRRNSLINTMTYIEMQETLDA